MKLLMLVQLSLSLTESGRKFQAVRPAIAKALSRAGI